MKELFGVFLLLMASQMREKSEGVFVQMKLPREALMCGPSLPKSQLSFACARARFVLDSSRVYFTSALNF